MINGVNPATFFILPMLGKHPDAYPRFRDCFTGDPDHPEYDHYIHVYTRIGGGNREDYEKEINDLRSMEGYVIDHDDDFDTTFATFVFKVPSNFQEDYKKISEGKIKETSVEYRKMLYDVYPKLKEKLDELFTVSPSTEQGEKV